jgi:hypothetical protein
MHNDVLPLDAGAQRGIARSGPRVALDASGSGAHVSLRQWRSSPQGPGHSNTKDSIETYLYASLCYPLLLSIIILL